MAAALVALAGCQGFVDALNCDDVAQAHRTPVTIYETRCYGGLAPGCVTRPQTEWRENADSRRVMQSCMANRRLQREMATVTIPPPLPQPTPRGAPSPANSTDWRAFGGTQVLDAPSFSGRIVHVAAYGEVLTPLTDVQSGWVRVALDTGKMGFVRANQMWQGRP